MKRYLIIFLFLFGCAQIDTAVKPGNERFVVGNGDIGVILTHGLAASPYEVKGLAEYLAERNITVYAVRLAGHGTSVEDLDTKTWFNWYDDFNDAYLVAKENKTKIFAGGMSLGANLALLLAAHNDVDGIIALAPSLMLKDGAVNYAWIIKYFMKHRKRDIPQDRKQYYYSSFSVSGIDETLKLGKIVRNGLNRVNEPILIMQYTNDTRVEPESSQVVYDDVNSTEKELYWVNGTGHVFLLDEGKEKYFEKIYQFILNNS